MSFSYATDKNSSFVVPPSRDYLVGHDESQHEIQNRKHVAHAFLESGLPIASGNRTPALPRGYRARGTLRSRTRCGQRCPVASERSEEHTYELQSQSNLVCRL